MAKKRVAIGPLDICHVALSPTILQYQVYKSLIVFHIQEINIEVIKYRKNQTMENIKKETGVQSFTEKRGGEIVEI